MATPSVTAEHVAETVAAIEKMRDEGLDWPDIAKALGVKQHSLSKRFLRWRNQGLTTLAVPQGPQRVPDLPDADVIELPKIGPWRHKAACNDEDPELFFPGDGQNANEARRICRQCPVRTECLSWAMETNEEHGVWGGLSAKQRIMLKRNRIRKRGSNAA